MAIATIMTMVLVISFVQNVVIREQTLRAEDNDRLNEMVVVDAVYFNTDGNLTIDVTNTGGLPSHLIGLWVYNLTVYDRTELDHYLDVQQSYSIEVNVDHLAFNADDVFIVKTITERGNVYSRTYSLDPPPGVKESGIFSVNWFYSTYTSQSQTTPIDARKISIDDRYIAFYLEVKNNWIIPCTITEWSVLALVIAHIEPIFFIAKSVDYTGIPSTVPFEPLIVQPQESAVLTFASIQPKSDEFAWEYNGFGQNYPQGLRNLLGDEEGAGIQISLFFEMNGELLGQTISTQAVLLYDP
jgi:hypothetical protein